MDSWQWRASPLSKHIQTSLLSFTSLGTQIFGFRGIHANHCQSIEYQPPYCNQLCPCLPTFPNQCRWHSNHISAAAVAISSASAPAWPRALGCTPMGLCSRIWACDGVCPKTIQRAAYRSSSKTWWWRFSILQTPGTLHLERGTARNEFPSLSFIFLPDLSLIYLYRFSHCHHVTRVGSTMDKEQGTGRPMWLRTAYEFMTLLVLNVKLLSPNPARMNRIISVCCILLYPFRVLLEVKCVILLFLLPPLVSWTSLVLGISAAPAGRSMLRGASLRPRASPPSPANGGFSSWKWLNMVKLC